MNENLKRIYTDDLADVEGYRRFFLLDLLLVVHFYFCFLLLITFS